MEECGRFDIYMWFVTNGDIRMICPDDISCFLSVVKFLNEI